MKKYTVPQLLSLFGGPGVMGLIGAVLLLSPDTASALVSKLLAWGFLLYGLYRGVKIFLNPDRRGNILLAAGCVLVGLFLLMNPLFLAGILGRVVGLLLVLRGISHLKSQSGKPILPGAMILVGAVLIFVPLATTRMIFSVVGIVLLAMAVAEIWDILKGRPQLEEGGDPNIIDVEKV